MAGTQPDAPRQGGQSPSEVTTAAVSPAGGPPAAAAPTAGPPAGGPPAAAAPRGGTSDNEARGQRRAHRFDLDRPLLPESTGDDTDAGWAERPADNDARLLADRPPHWG